MSIEVSDDSPDESHAAKAADKGNGLPTITDLTRVKSLIHPLRVRLYEELFARGPSTATELANILGDSQANCSWHLRHLHKNGFVEEAPHRKGRSRPWQIAPRAFNIDFPDDEETNEPGPSPILNEELTDAMLNVHLDTMRRWIDHRRSIDPEWRDASRAALSLGYLTQAELKDLNADLHAVAEAHLVARADRFDPANRPSEARAVRLIAWTTPGPALTGTDSETPQENTHPQAKET